MKRHDDAISTHELCPSRKIALSVEDLIKADMDRIDWANHMNDPLPVIPKFKEIKANWTTATWHAFRE